MINNDVLDMALDLAVAELCKDYEGIEKMLMFHALRNSFIERAMDGVKAEDKTDEMVD